MLTSFADDETLSLSIIAARPATCSSRCEAASSSERSARSARARALLDPAVTNAVLGRLRRGKHLMKDDRLARLSRGGTNPYGFKPRGIHRVVVGTRSTGFGMDASSKNPEALHGGAQPSRLGSKVECEPCLA
jgi:hypothetical protein